MKKAFTMIELIFVIVIIGVLATVAIPKLSATRDDAIISKIVHNANTLFADFESYYYSQGNTAWINETIKSVTDVPIGISCSNMVEDTTKITPNTFVLCHEDTVCLSFTTTNIGLLTIADGISTTDKICEAVKDAVSFSNEEHQLGGNTINR